MVEKGPKLDIVSGCALYVEPYRQQLRGSTSCIYQI